MKLFTKKTPDEKLFKGIDQLNPSKVEKALADGADPNEVTDGQSALDKCAEVASGISAELIYSPSSTNIREIKKLKSIWDSVVDAGGDFSDPESYNIEFGDGRSINLLDQGVVPLLSLARQYTPS